MSLNLTQIQTAACLTSGLTWPQIRQSGVEGDDIRQMAACLARIHGHAWEDIGSLMGQDWRRPKQEVTLGQERAFRYSYLQRMYDVLAEQAEALAKDMA